MKRASFLKSVVGLLAASSISKEIDEKKALPHKSISQINDLRVGDIVRFEDGVVARVMAVSLGQPSFRNIHSCEPINSKLKYKKIISYPT